MFILLFMNQKDSYVTKIQLTTMKLLLKSDIHNIYIIYHIKIV